MSDLITKEELLKLGFVAYSERNDVYDWTKTGFILDKIGDHIGNKIDVFTNEYKIILATYSTMKCVNEDCYLTMEIDPTKANVLKLIEIAKLIGELE